MNINDQIELYYRFNEGTELEDAVQSLTLAASTLSGINQDDKAEIILIIVRMLISEYIDYLRFSCLSWEDYKVIDDELFKYITGGANKLTKDEYENHISSR